MADQQTNTTALPDHEEPISEFRNQCRKFYRRSTSVVQSSGSLPGLLDEDAVSNGTDNLTPKKDDENDKQKSRVVVEAIERLVEESHGSNESPQAQSYRSFLKAQSAENIDILSSCGLPTTEDEARKIQGDALETLIAIRTEERKWSVNMRMK